MTARRTIRRSAAALLVAGLFAGLGACAVRLPGGGEPAQLYVLTPKSTYPEDLPTVDWQLLVETPIAPAGLDTPRIAVSYSPIELDYFARAVWTDRAPQMVQRLLIESFENSGRIVGVGRDAVGLRSDFVLKTELREFQAEYRRTQPAADMIVPGERTGEAPVVRVRINAKIVRMPRREIVGSENFEHVVQAAENTMKDIIIAYDDALGASIKNVVVWTLREGERIRRSSSR